MNEASLGWLMEHLGVSAGAINRSFSTRFRLQKAAYLLKQLGCQAFCEYDFNLYIHGPYSPALAGRYYSAKPGGSADIDRDRREAGLVRRPLRYLH